METSTLTEAQKRRLGSTRNLSLFEEAESGPLPEGTVTIAGVVAGIRFARPPEWSVITVTPDDAKPDDEPITVCGKGIPDVGEGTRVKVVGKWTSHPRFGKQVAADWVSTEASSMAVVAAGFLRTRVDGIGPKRASALLDAFGDELPDVLRSRSRLQGVQGIGPQLADEIATRWEALTPLDLADLELAGLGVTEAARASLLMKFGPGAASMVKDNPWIAAKARGLGLADADRLAQRLGVPFSRPERVHAVVLHAVGQAVNQDGSTRVSESAVITEAVERDVLVPACLDAIKLLEEEGELVRRGQQIAPAWLDRLEGLIAEHLRRLLTSWTPILDPIAPSVPGVTLTDEQREKVIAVQRDGVAVLSGRPGTGKTTITRSVCDAFQAAGFEVLCCSPTGRAAEQLRQATGRDSATIHRLLGYGAMGWSVNRANPLPRCLLVVDEFSMVDTVLAWHVLDALQDGSALLMVGDHDQLPSVGPGAVLRDLVETRAVPVHVLTRIMRQAAGNPVIEACHAIQERRTPVTKRTEQGDVLVLHERKDGTALDTAEDVGDAVVATVDWLRTTRGLGPRDVQVLSVGKKGPAGTKEMNKRLRRVWLPNVADDVRFPVGTLVMQTKNDYQAAVWNGTQGIVTSSTGDGVSTRIDWDGPGEQDVGSEKIGLVTEAWDCTVHKAQGSQWPWIVVVLHLSMGYPLHVREVLYTAVSRARRGVVIVCDRKSLGTAVRNTSGTRRVTGLPEALGVGTVAAAPVPAVRTGRRVSR